MNEHTLSSLLKLPAAKATEFLKLVHSVDISMLKNDYSNKNIGYTTVFEEEYPYLLKRIYDPPWVLYYQGKKEYLNSSLALSVVGTRHPSGYVQSELKSILTPVIKRNILIISGLALGVDRMAHEITVGLKGRTIAVLGYGLDHIYPLGNKEIFNILKEEHLLLSEYPPYVKPQRWLFPERNRIISGLSQATFVVEAKEKSGSLITCDLALQQNRDVFALPGRVSHEESTGTNKLIQEGAKIILKANDIVEEYFPLDF